MQISPATLKTKQNKHFVFPEITASVVSKCYFDVFERESERGKKKKRFHMVTGGGHKRSCHAHCPTIGSLPFSALLGLQTTSYNQDRSVFLNVQIWHCPIRPIHISTNQMPVSTSTRFCRPQGNYCMVVKCKLVAHRSK